MSSRDNSIEVAAGEEVARILGGEYEMNDTGGDGQHDVRVTTAEGRLVALEATSFGGDDWKRTGARIQAEQDRGSHAGERLRHQWWVVVPTGIGVRELQPRLDELLERLEQAGLAWATSAYDGDDSVLRWTAGELQDLRVTSVGVWEESPEADQPRVLISQSERVIGTSGSLPAALAAVFAKGDNQEKLARADCDERHLHIFMEDRGAGAVLRGQWPLPACPVDPDCVIDTVWVYSPEVSSYVFRVQPGTANWQRFISVTGEPAQPASESG